MRLIVITLLSIWCVSGLLMGCIFGGWGALSFFVATLVIAGAWDSMIDNKP